MSHLKEIMRIKEEEMDRVVFVSSKKEGGINAIYDPRSDSEVYQVFIQQSFPLREISSWEFSSFRDARNFAASHFKAWEMLNWNHGVNRPCGKGDSCGGGNCGRKKNADGTESASSCGGGCTTCGATKEFDDLLSE